MKCFWQVYAMVRGQMLVALSYPIDLALGLANMIFTVAAFRFLSKYLLRSAGGGETSASYFSFVVLGIVFSSLLTAWFSSFSGELRQFQTTGVLEMLLATGAKPGLIVTGMTSASLVLAVIESIGAVLVAKLLFQLNATVVSWTILFAAVCLGLVIYCFLGLLSAGFVLLFKRGNPIAFIFDKTSVLLGGVYFPVAALPSHLQKLAEWFPLTHLLRLLRISAGASGTNSGVESEFLVLAGMTIVLICAATAAFHKCVRVVLRHGTTAHY